MRKVAFVAMLTVYCAFSQQALAHPNIEENIQRLNTDLEKEGASAQILVNRGDLYLEHEELEKAVSDYHLALKLDKNYWKANYGLARVFFIQNKTSEALLETERINNCSEKSECWTNFLFLRAQIFSKVKQNVKALDALNSLVKIGASADPSLYVWQADLLEESRDYEKALNIILEGLQASPNVPALIDKALFLQEKLNKIDEAILLLESCLANTSRKDLIYLKQSELLLRNDRVAEARVAAKKGLYEIELLPEKLRQRPALKQIVVKLQQIVSEVKS